MVMAKMVTENSGTRRCIKREVAVARDAGNAADKPEAKSECSLGGQK